ncbi:T9SS type A sorting domain-containing protein [Mucilaginibacter mali]|uniref:T9SS type A sorting domain-containing protein n=1 Tax=Mucilaginibacter mali TaxID=2740462 RepID=A0A7D4TNG9_9SPHI|nr:T9SS type A sorting domain-containing protein [Mucilaginibacter mali]QKJ30953.1 T9SS type A sorting domain-containing protein [Mucilaginibacter mali]
MKRLLSIILSVLILCTIVSQNTYAQINVTGANAGGNGITSNPLVSGDTGDVLFGFTLTNTTGSAIPINQFVLGATQAFVGNAYLYRSAAGSTSFSTATSIQSLGSLATYISINVSESIPANSKYTYFIVGDLNSIPGYVTLPSTIQFSFSSAIQNSPYTTYGSAFNGTNFTINNPTYSISDASNTSNGMTASPVTTTQTGIVLFGFGVSANATTTVSGFNLNSTSTQNYLSYYLGNGKLYRSTSSTFTVGTSTLVASGSNVSFSNYQHTPGVTITNLNETITGTKIYYFLVADFNQTSGTLPATIQFKIQTSLANTIVQSSPNSANIASSININGNNFVLQNPTYTITGANASGNGITQGTLTPGQTGIVLYGFALSADANTTVSEFHLYNTYTQGVAQAYFNNGKIYRSTSSTFSLATATQITGSAAVAFGYDNNSGISITGLSESVSSTPVYYFIVGDFYTGYYGALSARSQFVFRTSLSNSIVQTSPSSANIAVGSNVNGTNFTLDLPSVTFTGYNTTSNGISDGALYYGRTDIVLFGFSVQSTGLINITNFHIKTTGNENSYFSNCRLYRSTTNVYPGGTPLYTSANVSASGGGYFDATVTESLTGSTTYYYWLVADYNSVTYGGVNTTFRCSFAKNQSGPAALQSDRGDFSPSGTINGLQFDIASTENWTGGTSNDFTVAGNFTLLNGGTGFKPTTTTFVIIGTAGYTNAPTITANTTLGGLTFGSTQNPSITINSGVTLTISSGSGGGLYINPGSTLTVNGPGTLKLNNNTISTIASTGRLVLAGGATIDNTLNTGGSFTLLSDASGTGSIATIPSNSSLTGTYTVQRYFTGGTLANRGYRLMSFPVNTNSIRPVTTSALSNFTSFKSNLLITGAGGSASGWDQPSGYTANGPTILFYNTANNNFTIPTTFSATTAAAGQGFYFYFRGDNVNNLTNKVIKSGTYAVPETGIVGLQTGTLNQQDFNYSLSNSNLGYNLVGNPYPSSISVTQASLTNTNNTVYTYTSGGTSITAHSVTSTPWQIASGQGFFLKATSSGASIAFSESLKSTGQPTLLMGTPAAVPEGNILLQMVQDSANYDFAELRFMDSYNKNYVEAEDADDLNGSGQVVFFGAMTADNHLVAIASQPFDKKRTSVYLSVNDNTSGTFKINKVNLNAIPDKYDVWLMDHFKNDSLDLRAGTTYSFAIDKNNAATYGSARLEVVVRTKVLPPYQLLTFTGNHIKNDNVLNWTTKNEYTYTYFELERSFDNKTFEGVNNSYSTGTGTYTFTDQSNKPLIYYRLKQTDINDNATYSSIVILKSDNSSAFSVYPNPTSNTLHFALTQEVKKTVTLRLYNSMGTLMKATTYTTNSGDQDVSNLTPGSYMAELIDDNNKKLIASAKFIKL